MENKRSRRWQLTENNASFDKKETAERLAKIAETTYVVACSEIGEKGTQHNHAFIIYHNAISLKSLKSAFPRAHFEPCKGSNGENRDYIVKQDKDYFESGEMPLGTMSVRKGDIASEVVNLLMQGQTLLEVISNSAYTDYVVKNFRSLKEVENEIQRELGLVNWKRSHRL